MESQQSQHPYRKTITIKGSTMFDTFAHNVIRWRWLIILVTVLLIGMAGKGMKQLTLTSDYRVFFSEENPQLAAFERLQNTYTKSDNILIVLAPKNRKAFTRETLAVVEQLTKDAWQVPYNLRVDSLSNFQHTRGVEDDLIVKDLYSNGADLLDSELEAIKQVALNEPLLVKRLISEAGDVTAVNVTINVPDENPRNQITEAVAYARDLAEKIRAEHQHLDVHITGTVMMNNAFPEAAKSDVRTLIPFMFLVVIITLWIMLRTLSGVFATILIIVFSIVTAMGLTGWLGVTLTPPTANVPTIILTLAVADCVHILVSYLYALRNGLEKKAAIHEAMRVNFTPVTLTTMTTAIGFLSMNFSDAPPFRDLGNMVAMGLVAAWALSFTFLPALMTVLPIRIKHGETRTQQLMIKLGDFVIRHRKPLLWGNILVVVALALAIPKNEMNDQFVEYFDHSIEFRRATDFVTDNLTGIYTIDYSLNAGEAGGLNEPAFLAKVDEFSEWFRAQPEVIHVNVFTDVMKRLNMNLHGDDTDYYRLPDERELAAQYLLLYEMSLPYGLDLNNQIDIDKSATRMNVTVENLTTNELLSLEQRAYAWLEDNAPEAMLTHGASPAIMFANIGMRNMKSMISGTVLALVLISFILIVALRSVSIGLLSLAPNLLPAAAAFGVWALLVGEVGVSLSIVISMTLGIVVDDTIHFLTKYLRARREKDLDAEGAIRYAFSTVGTALWVTTIVLMAGFSVLAFSAFKMNAGMGLMTAITIGIALLLDFLLLPPLLMKIQENPDDFKKTAAPATA
jgi:predicted RND superfamily exporter protein